MRSWKCWSLQDKPVFILNSFETSKWEKWQSTEESFTQDFFTVPAAQLPLGALGLSRPWGLWRRSFIELRAGSGWRLAVGLCAVCAVLGISPFSGHFTSLSPPTHQSYPEEVSGDLISSPTEALRHLLHSFKILKWLGYRDLKERQSVI